MKNKTLRPPVWIGHVAMFSARVAESSDFMQKIGMRLIFSDDGIAVLEMRGGTHLVITNNSESSLISSGFDLMVEDLEATHAEYVELGLEPGKIQRGSIHDNFQVEEPGGMIITFNSSHVGELPV
ncbi:MAG: catechol 2,3-dioxygenase-like lactoylglutathione lyase family enzyme [Gammaproteobacteria bacterium]|jgi:catechol 2,3-dioxygenase-like lactoylglutathione lyase family enzyme